jgi:hypothetical protein
MMTSMRVLKAMIFSRQALKALSDNDDKSSIYHRLSLRALTVSDMHATPPPHCDPAVCAPVVFLVLLPGAVFLALVLCWQMLCHRTLLQEILRVQKALLQAATASQSVQCPALPTEDRRDPCNGDAVNVGDQSVLHSRLQWPSASEQGSAADDSRTAAADKSQTQAMIRRTASAPTVPPLPRISCSLRKGAGIKRSSSIIDAPNLRQATSPTDTKERKKKLPSSGTAGYCLCYCG